MKLGAFSISLSVADLAASRAFYEQLGFDVIGGDAEQNWLILRNGESTMSAPNGDGTVQTLPVESSKCAAFL